MKLIYDNDYDNINDNDYDDIKLLSFISNCWDRKIYISRRIRADLTKKNPNFRY